MEVYQGKSVFGGIAIGRISVHKKDEQQVKRVKIEDPEQEILRYRQAKQTAMEQLDNLRAGQETSPAVMLPVTLVERASTG